VVVVPWRTVQIHAHSVAGWGLAALGFSLPISTSLDGILLVITVVAWLISGAFCELPRIVRENRYALLLPGLFVLIALGMIHGLVPFGERAKHLWKYDDLLLSLVFITLFLDPAVRERGLWAFGISMGLTLVISLGIAAGWIPVTSWFHGRPANATVFKLHITHNVLMAFAALLFAEVAVRCRELWQRYALGLLALCAVIDVFMFVQGRTGQVSLGLLIVLWWHRRLGMRGLFVGATAVVLLLVFSYTVSPVFQKRVEKTISQVEQAQVAGASSKGSSVGLRLEWYRNTAQLITAHPLVGVGTGSFAEAYREIVTELGASKPSHPHNQYLLTASELGVAGAGLLLWLFGLLCWKFRTGGGHVFVPLGEGAMVMLAIGCLFNSFLVDHTEGLFFAWVVSAALAANAAEEGGQAC